MEPQEQQEQPIMKLHPSFLGFFGYYLMGGILIIAGIASLVFGLFTLGAVGVLAGVITFFLAEISRRAETFYLLENGVAGEYKMLSTSRKFVDYQNIQNMEVNQNFIENIFRIGNVRFVTAGTEKMEILSFHKVSDPYGIEEMVQNKMKG